MDTSCYNHRRTTTQDSDENLGQDLDEILGSCTPVVTTAVIDTIGHVILTVFTGTTLVVPTV